MVKKRIVNNISSKKDKNVVKSAVSSDNEIIAWRFHRIDKNGVFAFDPDREDFDRKLIFDKILEFSNMKWAQLKMATHDQSKSKHHFIGYESMSSIAKSRFDALKLNNDEDRVFSIAVNNLIRIIGLRNNSFFDVIWYDPKHEFCPSKLKHT